MDDLILKKKVLTMDEAVTYTGMSKHTLYKLTSGKKIRHSKPNGKMIFFLRADLDGWMLKNTQEVNNK